MSITICAKCGRYVDTDREEVLRWMENGEVICFRLPCIESDEEEAA